MQELDNMGVGIMAKVEPEEEIGQRPRMELQMKPKRLRLHGKGPEFRQGHPRVFKLDVTGDDGPLHAEEEHRRRLRENAIERLMVQQHRALTRWMRDTIIAIEDQRACPEEIELALNAKEELAGMEENLTEMVSLRKIELEQEEVLQSRLVAMHEVRRNMDERRPVFQEEINNLTARALRPINQEQFEELLKGDVEVESLPMKAIASLKPPARKKGRIVVRGNYAEQRGEELQNAAGGVGSVAIRAMLAVATQRKWECATVDVKAAFLQAPRRTRSTRLTIGEPPNVIKSMGLIEPGTRWLIDYALYGLVESPGDWGAHRDEQLPKLRWFVEGYEYALKETKERHVWKVYKTQAPDEEHGYVLVYVDDMLILGQDAQVTAVAEAIKTLWECSPMERLKLNKTMRFCGFELTRERDGMFLGQTGYIKDLLQRRGVQGEEAAPLPKVNEEEEEEEPNAGELKKAQMLIGEMMWLNRTRPDLCYATGLLSRMAYRRPRYVNQLGNYLLKYLNKTADHGLYYRPCGYGDLAEDEQLPKSENRLIVYSDVSFAPPAECYRSIQSIACDWAGMLVMWDSTRQPYVAQSTGEAELISYSSAHQAGEATAVSRMRATTWRNCCMEIVKLGWRQPQMRPDLGGPGVCASGRMDYVMRYGDLRNPSGKRGI